MCGPSLCGDGRVKWEDGDCYTLGDQGPCEDGEYLSVSSSSLEPQCFVKKVRVHFDEKMIFLLSVFLEVPRVYDMLPKNIGLITSAPVSRHMKLSDKCKMNRRRKCRKLYFPTKRSRQVLINITMNLSLKFDFSVGTQTYLLENLIQKST